MNLMPELIETIAKIIAFAGRSKNDASVDADEFWWRTKKAGKERYLAMASAALALLPGEPDGWIWEDEFTCEPDVYQTWVEAGREATPFYFTPHLSVDREALLEEAREALDKIAKAPAWGAPERWETTPAEVRQLARAIVDKIEKGVGR
ncbi:hypothetical protein A6U86_05675 [Rhizobium sp. AC27/96]|uniref:hypothetical protein n=1 Tax=Rhizobium sp. AC27/96 TaxID=1841653 RepID=UPI0008294144|nr:hypothetical protein [Rhizobium sp. AC27/96]OCJ12512.1 hypothetical protein A6U86_05675 [Rhizobium sp. AC27/96]